MAYFHDLPIPKLMKILADKTLEAPNDAEFEKLSSDEIESACTLLPDILTAFRRAANSRARVNSLPPEILLRIFAFIPQTPQLTVFDTIRSVCGPLSTRQVWELRAVTQVCHRWRSVALNVSSLWSSAFHKPYLVSRCGIIPENANYLWRCLVGPIQIYIEELDGVILPKWKPSPPIDAPPGYEDRVEELHVVTMDGWKYGSLPPSLSSPGMDALQRLVVRSLHSGVMGSSRWQWHGLQPVFMGQALPIRSLAIIDSPFLPSNLAPVLTHLVLFYDMKREMHETWSLRDLLSFLSTTPALEEAVICGIPLLGSVQGQREPLPTAHLENLRKLSIRAWNYLNPGSPGTPFPLLWHIVIPQTCYLRLDANMVDEIRSLAVHFRNRRWDVPASSVHCVWGASPYTMSSLQATFPASGGGIRVDFQTFHDTQAHPHEDLASALHALLETPPFAAAQAFWASRSGMDNACDMRLTQSLAVLLGVKSLYIANDTLQEPGHFVEFLGNPSPTASDAPHIPFPILETFYVTVYDRHGVEKLAEMLRRRADRGCKLSHLLVRCVEVGCDEEDTTAALGEAELGSILRGAVEKVTVLDEDDYRKDYALRTVLPPLCTFPGGGLIWPPWTENETTFSLMHLT